MKIVRLLMVGGVALLLIIEGMYMGPLWRTHSEETIRDYHLMMYANPAMWNLKWVGIYTQQNPNDVWIIQEIISEVKPDIIIETGTDRGGSAVIWAMIQVLVNRNGRVITIDIEKRVDKGKFPASFLDKIDFVIGDSVDPMIVTKVGERARGQKTLVILDSDHHKEHVIKELEKYAPMVSVGSYIIVQDTDISGHPIRPANYQGPGPMEAVEEFLPRHKEFKVDKDREKLLFTMHPNGYLRRIK